jgi:Protein of unknown function (DUF3592)
VSSDKRAVLQFIGVANLVVGILFALVSTPFFWKQVQVLGSWPVTEAQVLRSEVASQPAPDHQQLYSAKLLLLYTVDGKPITAELTSFQSRNYEETAKRAGEFPVGSRHRIRYDWRNPAQARIGAGWNRRFFAVPLIMLGMGAIFAGIAAGCFVAARLIHRRPALSST